MFLNDLELKKGAFVVSDAHYSHIRPEFLNFLKAIHTKKLKPTQLILMGDIFDTLFGGVPYSQKVNSQAVQILNEISEKLEVIYLEGNHDFNLKSVFPKAKIFTINQQPVKMIYNSKILLLAHGDINSPIIYNIYTAIVRNPLVLWVLNMLDSLFNHFIINRLDEYLSKKDDCKEFKGFKKYIEKRLLLKYSCDYFLEGHFHQNKSLKFEDFTYINLAAFACNQRYFIVKSLQDVELLEEKTFSK